MSLNTVVQWKEIWGYYSTANKVEVFYQTKHLKIYPQEKSFYPKATLYKMHIMKENKKYDKMK